MLFLLMLFIMHCCIIDTLPEINFYHCNVVVSDLYDGKSQNKIAIAIPIATFKLLLIVLFHTLFFRIVICVCEQNFVQIVQK